MTHLDLAGSPLMLTQSGFDSFVCNETGLPKTYGVAIAI
jgi:hypothetical protein